MKTRGRRQRRHFRRTSETELRIVTVLVKTPIFARFCSVIHRKLSDSSPSLVQTSGVPHIQSTGECGMRVLWVFLGILPAASGLLWAQPSEAARQLVREVVYNELQDHDTHGYWRYWIQQRVQNGTQLENQVETADGPITRIVQANGQPLAPRAQDAEQSRLDHLVNSPLARAAHRRAYLEDETRIRGIFALLPDAFLYQFVAVENGWRHLHFQPNPGFAPHSIQSRIFHAMSGDIWLDARMKRLVRLQGHLDDNVDFGFGLLGRLDRGGWFLMHRVQVSPTEWKTQQLEIHMSGRAMLFNTIARQTSELRGGFAAVPAGINLAQGMRLLEQPDPRSGPNTVARVSPVSLSTRR